MLIGRPSRFVQGSYTSLALATGTASTSPDYGLASLIDAVHTAKYLLIVDSPVVAVRVVWDHGAPVRIDGARLGKHNLDAGLGVRIQRHTANVWTAPTQDAGLTIAAAHEDGHSTSPWVDLRTVAGYTTDGFQYTSLYVPINSVAPKLGGVVFIQQFDLVDRGLEWGLRSGEQRPSILSLETESEECTYYRRRLKHRYLTGQVTPTDADWLIWRALHRDTDGPYLPFLFIQDESITSDDALLVRMSGTMSDRLERTEDFLDRSTLAVDLIEASRGLPL